MRAYAEAANAAAVPVVEVGHGNGLGASSLQVGQARLSDDEMLSIVRKALTDSKLGVFLLPGWGTTQDIKNAISHGADLVRIGTHCTEASLAESVSIVSGLAGVFSGFKNRVIDISAREGVDPRDVFFELGRLQAVAGQEDLIVDVALALRGSQAESDGQRGQR